MNRQSTKGRGRLLARVIAGLGTMALALTGPVGTHRDAAAITPTTAVFTGLTGAELLEQLKAMLDGLSDDWGARLSVSINALDDLLEGHLDENVEALNEELRRTVIALAGTIHATMSAAAALEACTAQDVRILESTLLADVAATTSGFVLGRREPYLAAGYRVDEGSMTRHTIVASDGGEMTFAGYLPDFAPDRCGPATARLRIGQTSSEVEIVSFGVRGVTVSIPPDIPAGVGELKVQYVPKRKIGGCRTGQPVNVSAPLPIVSGAARTADFEVSATASCDYPVSKKVVVSHTLTNRSASSSKSQTFDNVCAPKGWRYHRHEIDVRSGQGSYSINRTGNCFTFSLKADKAGYTLLNGVHLRLMQVEGGTGGARVRFDLWK